MGIQKQHQAPSHRFALGTGPEALTARERRAALVRAALVGVATLFAPLPAWARASAAAALATIVLVTLLVRWRRRSARAWLVVDKDGISRREATGPRETRIARFAEPFGLTVLSNRERTRAVFAFTTKDQTRFVPVRLAGAAPTPETRDLLARAATVTDGEALLGRTPDAPALSATDGMRLLRIVQEKTPATLDRILLSDSHGAAIALDGDSLTVGERSVDLRAPLEWRGFMFRESVGQVMMFYQATWIRQASTELVLVAPMPTEISSAMVGRATAMGEMARDSQVQRAALRDLRLALALPDVPPPREQRVGIERIFMLPLRRAIDRAPRLPRSALAQRAMPRREGRA
jgi:hypothetical protein